ncbi:MAG TPA: hypothetical protein VHU92_06895 [Streptosporangiaceae bacterium]|nr:hypothetical protein [Streptosporangiaceae bacterium]
MSGPAGVMATALRRMAVLMPADRRQWAEAVCAEADEAPAGRHRVSWLAGGLWLTVRQARLNDKLRLPLAFAAAAGGVAWAAWAGRPGDPAVMINRVDVLALAVLLVALHWAARRVGGPVAGSRLARLGRAGGYAAILALVLAKSAVERVADAPPNNHAGPAVAWTGEVIFLVCLLVFAGWIELVMTSAIGRARPSATTLIALLVGAFAIYVLTAAAVQLHSS